MVDRLVRAGLASRTARQPVKALRLIAAAGNELVRYHTDYRNQYEVEIVFGTFSQPEWRELRDGLSRFETLGWYKPFLPVYEIDHRAWRLYLIVRKSLDATLLISGLKPISRGFALFKGDMIHEKTEIAKELGLAGKKHLNAVSEMKSRWKGSMPRIHESFTNKEMVLNLIACLAVYDGACRLTKCSPVFDRLVENVNYIENIIDKSADYEWSPPGGFF